MVLRAERAFEPDRLINAFRTLDCFVTFYPYDFSQPSHPVYARIELSTSEKIRAELMQHLSKRFSYSTPDEAYIRDEIIDSTNGKVRYAIVVVAPIESRRDDTRLNASELLLHSLPREIDDFRMKRKK